MATRRGALGVRQYFLRQAALNERQTVGQEFALAGMAVAGVASWPFIAYTLHKVVEEETEHYPHMAAAAASVNYPHLNKNTGHVYGWGSPCTALDFVCDRKMKLARENSRAQAAVEKAQEDAAKAEELYNKLVNK